MSTPSQSSSEAGNKQEKPSSTGAAGQRDTYGLFEEYGVLDCDPEKPMYIMEVENGVLKARLQEPLRLPEADYSTLLRAFGLINPKENDSKLSTRTPKLKLRMMQVLSKWETVAASLEDRDRKLKRLLEEVEILERKSRELYYDVLRAHLKAQQRSSPSQSSVDTA